MKKSSYILSIFLLSSCAVRINTTGPRFESPESLGPLKELELYGSIDQGHQVEMSNQDILGNKYLPDTENPKIYRRLGVGGGLRAGLMERLEISYSALSALKVKFQVLGDPAYKSEEGIAIAVGAGVGAVTDGSNPFFLQTSGDSEVSGTLTEAIVSAGYRFNRSVMVYLSPYFANRRYDVETYDYNRDSYGNTISKNLIEKRNGYIQTKGISLGVEFRSEIKSGKGFVGVRPDINYTEIKAGNRSRKDGFIGLQGFVHF